MSAPALPVPDAAPARMDDQLTAAATARPGNEQPSPEAPPEIPPLEISPALNRALRGYLDHLAVERGAARNTLLSYRRDLDRYLESLAKQGVSATDAIEPGHVQRHLVELRTGHDGRPPLAASSAARAVVAVRGWHRFLLLEGITPTDPSADVHPPQAAKRLPKALPIESVTALLEATGGETETEPRGLRDRALLEVLYATGARISEAIDLDLDDLPDPPIADGSTGADTAVVRLFGKGSKERLVPIGSYARQALSTYLVRGRPALAAGGHGSPAVFLNARGGRLSRQSAWQVLKDSAERAGITDPVSPHTLRHSFATHLLAGGADVRVVQELLGHASVTTTQIYTLVTVDALREVYALSHPRAR